MSIKATIHLADENAGILRGAESIGQRLNSVVDRYARIMREERQLLLEQLKPAELALLQDAFRDYTGSVRDFEAWCAYIVQALPVASETRSYVSGLADAQFVALLELLEGPAPGHMLSGNESRAAIERLRTTPPIGRPPATR